MVDLGPLGPLTTPDDEQGLILAKDISREKLNGLIPVAGNVFIGEDDKCYSTQCHHIDGRYTLKQMTEQLSLLGWKYLLSVNRGPWVWEVYGTIGDGVPITDKKLDEDKDVRKLEI